MVQRQPRGGNVAATANHAACRGDERLMLCRCVQTTTPPPLFHTYRRAGGTPPRRHLGYRNTVRGLDMDVTMQA